MISIFIAMIYSLVLYLSIIINNINNFNNFDLIAYFGAFTLDYYIIGPLRTYYNLSIIEVIL